MKLKISERVYKNENEKSIRENGAGSSEIEKPNEFSERERTMKWKINLIPNKDYKSSAWALGQIWKHKN